MVVERMRALLGKMPVPQVNNVRPPVGGEVKHTTPYSLDARHHAAPSTSGDAEKRSAQVVYHPRRHIR